MRLLFLCSVALMLSLPACGISTSPPGRGPVDMAVAPPADGAVSQPDLVTGPQLISVSPTQLPRGTVPKLTVTGNAQAALDQQQTGVWAFPGCPIQGITYSPVDSTHCILEPDVPVTAVVGTKCDLTLTLKGGTVLKLPAALTIN